jgi:tetratricopeptide (TPR) repeat protein
MRILRLGAALAFAVTIATQAMAQPMDPAMGMAEEHHSHPAPEHLGAVTFPTSCKPGVSASFSRAVALLHSFAYADAERAFAGVATQDPSCAMAHWGVAMTHYHQLWEPPAGDQLAEGSAQARRAVEIGGGTPRERAFIAALALYYAGADAASATDRAERYSHAMADLARSDPADSEAQIFYALSLIATAPPTDRAHANQKRAIAILEPIYRRQPQHPGLAHYLIHACDSAELAEHGLPAARAYSKIAPSAPHALHMPSHIFTRLGLWDDSIASNIAARAAARAQGDVGEQLHAMDYLTYAYLQRGRYQEAEAVVAALKGMAGLPASQFKVGYAATAMPVRIAVEQHDWDAAARLEPLPGTSPQVAAIVYWARALGHARATPPSPAEGDIGQLQACVEALRAKGDRYWAAQAHAMLLEAQGWQSAAQGDAPTAIARLKAAADEEDAFEKLPVTPGPIVPAREQLGELLLRLNQPDQALQAFKATLTEAPRRRGGLVGAIAAAERLGDTRTVEQLRPLLP